MPLIAGFAVICDGPLILPNCPQGMFKDTELSSDVMGAFRMSSHFTEQLPNGIDMTVSVLTSGFWPTYPVADAKLPQV